MTAEVAWADEVGSPARAGIDHGLAQGRFAATRLPRTRGDRPRELAWMDRHMEAPPHARG